MSDDLKPYPYDNQDPSRIQRVSVARGEYQAPTGSTGLPPVAAAILGVVGAVGGLVAPLIPPPFGGLVLIVAFVCAALSGAAVRPPALTDGKPVLQGAAVGVASTVAAVAGQASTALPEGPWQVGATAVGLLAAWAAGKTAPALGAGARAP